MKKYIDFSNLEFSKNKITANIINNCYMYFHKCNFISNMNIMDDNVTNVAREYCKFHKLKKISIFKNLLIHLLPFTINWAWLAADYNISESFIEKYKNKLNWNSISRHQTLSESFIEKFKDKVDWGRISGCQKLSESFIEKFKDKVDWDQISSNQSLSESFIIKMKQYIAFSELPSKKLTTEVINNCYGCIKHIDKRRLRNKNILPEVKLYFEVN